MGCELRVFEPSNKIKACLMTAKGMIGVVLQVYSSEGAGTPSMVEVRGATPSTKCGDSLGVCSIRTHRTFKFRKVTCVLSVDCQVFASGKTTMPCTW